MGLSNILIVLLKLEGSSTILTFPTESPIAIYLSWNKLLTTVNDSKSFLDVKIYSYECAFILELLN